MKENTFRVLIALCCAAVLACSCGGKTVPLNERIHNYWEARIKGQLEQAFELESPGAITKQDYLKQMLTARIAFTNYSIKAIKEEADEAEVELQMEYLMPGLSRSASSSMSEKWIKVKGQWYHLLMRAGEKGETSGEGGDPRN